MSEDHTPASWKPGPVPLLSTPEIILSNFFAVSIWASKKGFWVCISYSMTSNNLHPQSSAMFSGVCRVCRGYTDQSYWSWFWPTFGLTFPAWRADLTPVPVPSAQGLWARHLILASSITIIMTAQPERWFTQLFSQISQALFRRVYSPNSGLRNMLYYFFLKDTNFVWISTRCTRCFPESLRYSIILSFITKPLRRSYH